MSLLPKYPRIALVATVLLAPVVVVLHAIEGMIEGWNDVVSVWYESRRILRVRRRERGSR